MVVEHTHALIYYNDSSDALRNRDYAFAAELKTYLRNNKIDADIRGYSDSILEADAYQWLIFIHSLEAMKPPMHDAINAARDRVVQRRMRGILAVTMTSDDLPAEWASIRRYDVHNAEVDTVLYSIQRGMQYAKVPYTQAQDLQGLRHKARPLLRRIGTTRIPATRRMLALMLTVVILLLLITVFGVVSIWNTITHSNAFNASQTATAAAYATQTNMQHMAATMTPQARQEELATIMKTAPALSGFQATDQWSAPAPSGGTPSVTNTQSCTVGANNSYLAVMNAPGYYVPCIAQKPMFGNFALQVTMQIQGDAGGIIFRANEASGIYYRLSINQSNPTTPGDDTLSLLLCNSDCLTMSVREGTSLLPATLSVPSSPVKPVTLALIAQNSSIDIFINGQFVTHVVDSTLLQGQIGVYAASVSDPTTVTFSRLKVWSLAA